MPSTIPALVAVLICSGAALAQQTARDSRTAPTAPIKPSIAGTVVAADSGRPVRRALVTLSTGARAVRSIQSDDQGAFTFSDVIAGEYTLSAAKGGFLDSVFGQKQPGSGRPGTPIRIAEGQKLKDISLPLARGGVITGRIVDETGEPAFGILVRAMRWTMQSGRRMLAQAGTATTDDRGVYRIHSLAPGDFLISAAPGLAAGSFTASDNFALKIAATLEADGTLRIRDGEIPSEVSSGFARVFYPGTTVGAAATAITLAPSEERSGVDFAMQVVPLARVSGTLMSPTGPAGAATVQLMEEGPVQFWGTRTTRTDQSGRFTFTGVVPGQYVLMTKATAKGGAQLEASGREAAEFLAAQKDAAKAKEVAALIQRVAPLWATSSISVDGRDVTDVQLNLQPGLTVSGQVSVDGGDAAVNLSRMTLSLTPLIPMGEFSQVIPGTVEPNGQFTIRGVTPGLYSMSVLGGLPAGHALQSAVFGGQDILDVPVEIDGTRNISSGTVTLSTRTSEVTGNVRDGSGQAAPGFTVIAFTADQRFWLPGSRRIQAVRPSSDGRYQFRSLPPGEYRIVAVQDVEPGRWFDPEYLRGLSGFASVTIAPGGKHTQDFQVR